MTLFDKIVQGANLTMPKLFETDTAKQWKTNNIFKIISTQTSDANNTNQNIMRKTIKVNCVNQLENSTYIQNLIESAAYGCWLNNLANLHEEKKITIEQTRQFWHYGPCNLSEKPYPFDI